MARGSFPVSLILKAVDNATEPLRKVNKQLSGFAKAAKQARSAGRKMSLGITAPLSAIGAVSLNSFMKFQDGLATVGTNIDTSKESLEEMGKEIIALGRKVPVSIGHLTEGLASVRAAGIGAADQFKVLEGSARLATATGLNTTEAATFATSAIKSFGLEGEAAETIYGKLFQTAASGGLQSVSELARGFGRVAPTMAATGVELDEYLAGVSALTAAGIPATKAQMDLRAAVDKLSKPGKEASAVFKHLGASSFKDLIAQSGGLVPALDRIKVAVRGNEQRIAGMVGSAKAAQTVFALTGKQAGAFRESLDALQGSTEELERAYKEKSETIAAQKQRMANALESISISIGRILAPAIERIVPLIDSMADSWSELSPTTQKLAVVFGALAAAIGPALILFSSFVTVVGAGAKVVGSLVGWSKYLWMMRASIMSGLIPSLKAAIASVWSFTAALLANPITWIIIAIAALGAAVYQIYKNWEPLKIFFAEVWEGAVATMKGAWEGITGFFSGLWDGVVEIFSAAWKKIQPIVETVQKLFKYSPIGLALKAGKAVGGALFGGSDDRPSLGAAQAAPGANGRDTEARVVVDFNNMPRGTKVTQDPQNTTPMDLSMGYSMLGAT